MSTFQPVFEPVEPDHHDVTFGDLIELPWISDAHLRPASERLMPVTMKRGATGFRPSEQHETSDRWLAYSQQASSARNMIRAVIVSDECQVEGVLRGRVPHAQNGRDPGGRLLLAAIRPASPDEMSMRAFSRLVVADPGEWPAATTGYDHGAVLDFDQTFNVKLQASDVAAFAAGRIGIATRPDLLARRWSAYAVRRGPLLAQEAASQIHQILTGQTEPDALPDMFSFLSLLWAGEGQIEDHVSAMFEEIRLTPEPTRDDRRASLAPALREQLITAVRTVVTAGERAIEELEALGLAS